MLFILLLILSSCPIIGSDGKFLAENITLLTDQFPGNKLRTRKPNDARNRLRTPRQPFFQRATPRSPNRYENEEILSCKFCWQFFF